MIRGARSIIGMGIAGFLAACVNAPSGTVTSATQTACQGTEAMIWVGDGFLQSLCGCQEGSAKIAAGSPTALNCTVAAGSTVYFDYLGTTLVHQILSDGTPSFPSSPLSDPTTDPDTALRVYAVTLSAVGNYVFIEAYTPGLTGVLIAQ